ncbi:PREDICTED: interferon-induced protein with tetratricopeptide repeats 2-like [Cyprinodon variegatus]|uniref:Interferon-induced protein with tetratricopeptide repeats 2-like n=1 Tax=Cyprinodon variegatus TaxID=28743 RepID=A0A3Q2CUC9_CYPVA|nr:PREDICTED: interferon-induced protein with tetratricopeptide repeats 2-like [Cyprinodon variegatus]
MSSAQSLENKLEALQCNFTWNLDPGSHRLTVIQSIVEDIGTEEGNVWLGHIYNLRGFLQYKLGSSEEALKFFRRATETFQLLKNSDEGPWLMVNFGNLAWLHHLMGEDERSQDYLSKAEALMSKYPAPLKEELHPEVCAEKAWTLMRFDKEKAAELFQRAIEMQPIKEWQSSWAILKAEAHKRNMKDMTSDVFERMKSATEGDPENLYVAALYLEARAAKGEQIQNEAQALAERVLKRSPSSYNGMRPLLRLYRKYISKDAELELAEEALKRHPGSRYLKRFVASCLTIKILFSDYNPPDREINRAIKLQREVIDSYGESNPRDKINLAKLLAKAGKPEANKIYKELLDRKDLDLAKKQMLYNSYAKYSFFNKKDSRGSIKYHMMAAEIPIESKYRETSVTELKKTLYRIKDHEICERIKKLLTGLENQPETQNQ